MRRVEAGAARPNGAPLKWWTRLAMPFHTHCWVCTFYRGVAVGFSLGLACGAVAAGVVVVIMIGLH